MFAVGLNALLYHEHLFLGLSKHVCRPITKSKKHTELLALLPVSVALSSGHALNLHFVSLYLYCPCA